MTRDAYASQALMSGGCVWQPFVIKVPPIVFEVSGARCVIWGLSPSWCLKLVAIFC